MRDLKRVTRGYEVIDSDPRCPPNWPASKFGHIYLYNISHIVNARRHTTAYNCLICYITYLAWLTAISCIQGKNKVSSIVLAYRVELVDPFPSHHCIADRRCYINTEIGVHDGNTYILSTTNPAHRSADFY